MKKIFASLLIIIALVIFGNYYYQKHKHGNQDIKSASQQSSDRPQEEGTNSPETQKQQASSSIASDKKYYTMAEVAAHGADPDSEECWTVIHGKVYDILEFASNSHPGGELIFQACGIDATKLFETRPMGSKTPHSAEARKILEKYYIGDLKQ